MTCGSRDGRVSTPEPDTESVMHSLLFHFVFLFQLYTRFVLPMLDQAYTRSVQTARTNIGSTTRISRAALGIGLLCFHVVAGFRVCGLAFGFLARVFWALIFSRLVLVLGFQIFAQACGIRCLPFSSCRWDFARRQSFCYALFWRCGRRGGE